MMKNITLHQATVTRAHREAQNQHRSIMLWFTGLSGAGKSSLAHAVEEKLHLQHCRTYVLDGDNVRHGINSDLGFSLHDRTENLRRVGHIGRLFVDAGVIVLAAFISPLEQDREEIRNLFEQTDFLEIYCCASIEQCERRDTKGLYAKARSGEVSEFTGISSPYEVPANPDLLVETGSQSLESCVNAVMDMLKDKQIL